ncbi:hypothetical protein SAMN02745824_1948 [Parasphingorhabdus marina DSM 22363]|uniref:Uncharacterized protein n=1 Tax=Parasphingorhabdus marina DSM 22363 TaxID=1123272 RepID=A0A1N6EIZ2_9SPHN|nr:hypothetical protein [Parasphingorhabdus marina]SIN82978.1 hypothetical protein SAMN02745824_1948 [Parasphingorhabdus marina DSM 22363]
MTKAIAWTAATLMALTSSPALADDSAIDTSSMIEAAAVTPPTYQAADLPVSGFDLAALNSQQSPRFMATMESQYQAGYRIANITAPDLTDNSPGLASLIVPEEFAYRSTEQDSGVDALVPGQFISSSVRGELQSDTGPAARDKSSVGLRLPF